jgi:hypothetical protein
VKISYKEKNFQSESLTIIAQANVIINEYQEQGFRLTLRQLYYQFVARGYIENTQRSYKRLGSLVNDGRLAGLVDWDAIEDRTRNIQALPYWTEPQDIIRAAAKQFRFDRWAGQDYRVEVWIEKDALAGVIENVCNKYRVPFFSCRGYTSQSELWAAATRFVEHEGNNQQGVIVHLGDHDPSGIDMTRDIKDRFDIFGADVEVVRIALNMDQVNELRPPPNPAKLTDTRSAEYIKNYGTESWELDALDPAYMEKIIEAQITERIDKSLWNAAAQREEDARAKIAAIADNWE